MDVDAGGVWGLVQEEEEEVGFWVVLGVLDVVGVL